jgi:hypothetical protein
MIASNKPQRPDRATNLVLGADEAAAVAGLWAGSLGRTVRCAPTRRTVMAEVAGETVYGKFRRGHFRAALAEWRWLHLLPLLGFVVPRPIAWVGTKRRSLLVAASLPGRSLDAIAVDAARRGQDEAVRTFVTRVVALELRRWHDKGLVHRDWNSSHLHVLGGLTDGRVGVLDVERVFRPRWRRRRWIVKDLASFVASFPLDWSTWTWLRVLRGYLGQALPLHRGLVAEVVRKVRRIRAHVPRFG